MYFCCSESTKSSLWFIWWCVYSWFWYSHICQPAVTVSNWPWIYWIRGISVTAFLDSPSSQFVVNGTKNVFEILSMPPKSQPHFNSASPVVFLPGVNGLVYPIFPKRFLVKIGTPHCSRTAGRQVWLAICRFSNNSLTPKKWLTKVALSMQANGIFPKMFLQSPMANSHTVL